MASDTPKSRELPTRSSVTVSLSGEDEVKLTGYREKLVRGGSVTTLLNKAPWGDSFGMVVDKFGTNWMVNIADVAAEPAVAFVPGDAEFRDGVTRSLVGTSATENFCARRCAST
ncbi:hypothetical protein [Cryobacterium sp. Y50]|uniref:hypothetical protein n=1 Tax=Cryobacterium sp. Y50 TaxID=2048286 RepID=UPI000CE2CE3D|nr:hypothetical protein [Cryobacterium sp. Y50]